MSTPARTPVGPALDRSLPVTLLQSAHPRQALLTAAGAALLAGVAGRPVREVGLVAATVVVGQVMLGWDNDVVDRERDARHLRSGKPVADGRLEPGTVWFALCCALLLVGPLAIASGPRAAGAYAVVLLAGVAANRVLRRGVLSFVPWAVGFAAYPAFVVYGGWNGQGAATPPSWTVVALAAAVGLGAHVLRSLPGLVRDNEDGWRSLPLRIALRTGAPRLLVLANAFTLLAAVALLVAVRASGTG